MKSPYTIYSVHRVTTNSIEKLCQNNKYEGTINCSEISYICMSFVKQSRKPTLSVEITLVYYRSSKFHLTNI